MEVSRKNYNVLLKQFKECEKSTISLEEQKKLAVGRLEEAEKALSLLTSGRDPDEVVLRLEKEIEIRMETLRSKLLELEGIVTSNLTTKSDLDEIDI